MKIKRIAFAMPIVIICLGFVYPSLSYQNSKRVIAVSANEAADLIYKHGMDDKFAILDIRTPGEFQSGHLAKSIPID